MKKLIAILGAAALAAGCVEPSVDKYQPKESSRYAQVDNVEFDKSLSGYAAAELFVVKEFRRSTTNDGYEKIQAFLESKVDDRLRLKYRFDWYDSGGQKVEDPDNSSWEFLTINPQDDETLTSVAPQRDCRDFKLRVQHVEK